jgi:hypothetical protein
MFEEKVSNRLRQVIELDIQVLQISLDMSVVLGKGENGLIELEIEFECGLECKVWKFEQRAMFVYDQAAFRIVEE